MGLAAKMNPWNPVTFLDHSLGSITVLDSIPGEDGYVIITGIVTILKNMYVMPRGVLHYMGYTGMCSSKGYGFQPFWS